jgi:hypothetical protein
MAVDTLLAIFSARWAIYILLHISIAEFLRDIIDVSSRMYF